MRLGTFGYYADFLGSFSCSFILCVLAMSRDTWLLRAEWSASLLIGVGLWTLVEYGIHRWLYHGVELFVRLHDAHHKEPDAYIGAPPFVGIALIFLAIYLPGELASLTVASGLTTGVLVGYMTYRWFIMQRISGSQLAVVISTALACAIRVITTTASWATSALRACSGIRSSAPPLTYVTALP